MNEREAINRLAAEAHSIAVAKGWWDGNRPPLEICALIHSEVSEAVEEFRKGNPKDAMVELADAVIRILDFAGNFQEYDFGAILVNKMQVNRTREHRHGGKLY